MFGLFKKPSAKLKLNKKYLRLLKEAKDISTVNRALSNEKYFEAQEVLKEIEALDNE